MLLVKMVLLTPDSTFTPSAPLKAMLLAADVVDPPMRLPEAPRVMMTPWSSFPSGAAPVISVPMKFPWTTLLAAEAPLIRTPQWLAEIRLRAADVLPPIVLPADES